MKKIYKITIVLAIAVSAIVGLSSFTNEEKYFEIAKNLDIFATLFKEINTYYVDDVDPNQLIKVGIDAMLKSLDPYTNYIPEDDIEDYRFMTTGQYGGIGAVIGNRNGEVTILNPYLGFPAQKAGLLIGDIITMIDDIETKGKNTDDVSKLLKGQAGTKVLLKIKRFGTDSLINFELLRERIKVDNVPYYGMIDNEIGYIELSGFTQTASKEVRDALTSLKAQGAKKLVFDLRNNGGGLLQQAIEVSNVFIPKGMEVVSTKGKVAEWNNNYKTPANPLDEEMPVIMLTNGGTASAAEIVSGVVQDYDRGVLVGRTTYGKGLVQATRQLSYHSQLKVTTAKYYIPSGRCIQAIDYSNKVDGKGQKMADSLRTAYKTRLGRVVYDGKGLDPDIKIEALTFSDIATALIAKSLIFEYATEYRSKVKEIAPAKEFSISDEQYQEFVKWLANKEYTYETNAEKKLKELKTVAETEKLSDLISGDITAIETKIKKDKSSDLEKNKAEIKELLENEIVKRYYFSKGEVEATFDDDQDILKAIDLLRDEKQYKKILSVEKI